MEGKRVGRSELYTGGKIDRSGNNLNVKDEKDRGIKDDIQICFLPLMPLAEKRGTAEGLMERNTMMRHSGGDSYYGI